METLIFMSSKLRILQFGKYWEKDGGIETHVKTLCKGLANSEFEVINLVCGGCFKGNRFEQDGYTIVQSPSFFTYSSTSFAPTMALTALKLQEEKPFDIIHLHFPDPMSDLASKILPGHIPRVITWHSDIIRQKNLQKFYRPFQTRSIMRSKAIIAATSRHFENSDQIPEKYPENQRHVVPFGFYFDWLKVTPSVKEKQTAIRQKANGRNIVFALGRHVSYKGFKVLIEAMRYTGSHLILGGKGPLTEELLDFSRRLGLTDRIDFAGRISTEDLPAYYRECDIFCLPSVTKAEAFGIVQLEAMACGKPVICTQLNNGVNEINLHGLTGLAVPPNNAKKLADAINILATDHKSREVMGARGLERSIKQYSATQMVNKHTRIYYGLLNHY